MFRDIYAQEKSILEFVIDHLRLLYLYAKEREMLGKIIVNGSFIFPKISYIDYCRKKNKWYFLCTENA